MKAKNPLAKKATSTYKSGGVKKATPKYKTGGAKKSMRRYQTDGTVVNDNSSTTTSAPVVTSSTAAPALSLDQQKFNAEQAAAAAKAADIKAYENMLLTGNRRQRKYAQDKLTTSGVITGKKPRNGQVLTSALGALTGAFGAIAPYAFKKKEEKMGGSIKKKRGGRAGDSSATNTTKGQMAPMYKKGGVAKKAIKKFQSAGEYSTKAPAPQSATRNGKTYTKGADGTYTVTPVTPVKRKGGPARKK